MAVIDQVRAFCSKHGISTSRVLVMSAQQNRGTAFFSLIVDFEAQAMLDVYPAEVLAETTYKEMKLPGDVLLCYADNLPVPAQTALPPNWQQLSTVADKPPFCCSSVQPHKARRLEREIYFSDLEGTQGSHPDVVYEVKRQIDNGPMLSTTYWQLSQGEVQKANGTLHRSCMLFGTTNALFMGSSLALTSFELAAQVGTIAITCA